VMGGKGCKEVKPLWNDRLHMERDCVRVPRVKISMNIFCNSRCANCAIYDMVLLLLKTCTVFRWYVTHCYILAGLHADPVGGQEG
jgi:hypothetical protein